MKRVLLTYSTYSGSTPEVAAALAEELARSGAEVEARPMAEVHSLEGFDAVVVGGPMILGWHRKARAFLRKHRRTLATTPFAVFVMAMSLTETGTGDVEGVPLTFDPQLPKPPATPGRLSFKERYARPANYVLPILRSSRPGRPTSIGVFGGRLEYGRLPWYAVLFVMVFLKVPAGDRRNWPALRAWARAIVPGLGLD